MPMIPPTDITPADLQASLAAEQRLLALQARAERDGEAIHILKDGRRLRVLHLHNHFTHLGWPGDRNQRLIPRSRILYRLQGLGPLRRDEALRLLAEAVA